MAEVLTVAPFNIIRGDTWRSPKFSFFNEDVTKVLPPGFTQEDVDNAVAKKQLTFRDWRDYRIESDVLHGDINGNKWFILSDYKKIDTTGRFLWFEMTADETKQLEGKVFGPGELPMSGVYDIEFCKVGTGGNPSEVVTVWQGSVTLYPDITERDVC